MTKLLAALLISFSLFGPALAQSREEVDSRIDAILGDHQQVANVFETLQQAVADGDAETVAGLVSYPIIVSSGPEPVTIESAEDFVENYDSIITPEVADAVTGQAYEDLLVNDQGVMFGNGQLWLGGLCRDKSCASVDIKIVTIQSNAG